jgi:hypothetical protein
MRSTFAARGCEATAHRLHIKPPTIQPRCTADTPSADDVL